MHDYYSPNWTGVADAVRDYECVNGKLVKFPIGDGWSIAIVKV